MEINLYDKNGHAVAYIADDQEHSIYTWDGKAVCYLVEDKVYGWNGRHLGWFVDGIIYDEDGNRVGFVREKCPVLPSLPSFKSFKSFKNFKDFREFSHFRPCFTLNVSNMSLIDFILQGAN